MSSETSRPGGGSIASDENVLAALSQLELKTARPAAAKKQPAKKPESPREERIAPSSPPPASSPAVTNGGNQEKPKTATAPPPLPAENKVTSVWAEEEPSLAPTPPAVKPQEPRQNALPQNPAAGKIFADPSAAQQRPMPPQQRLERPPLQPIDGPRTPAPSRPPSTAPAAAPTPAATPAATPAPVSKSPEKFDLNGARNGSHAKGSPESAPTTTEKSSIAAGSQPEPLTSPYSPSPVAPTTTTTSPIAATQPISAAPSGQHPSARSLDLKRENEKQKRFRRKNSLVHQRAEGEPSHRGIKILGVGLIACAVAALGYFGYQSLFGASGDPPEGRVPNPDGQPKEIVLPGGDPAAPSDGGTGTTPPINPNTAKEIENELAILRARNELTRLADIAINKGSREAYENILKVLEDPNQARLADAAGAEVLRVQQFYFQSNRPQNYRIPAKEIFGDPSLESERDLTTHQKIGLLTDTSRDWRTRTKAAFILAGVRDLDAADALVSAIQSDPDLNVVKEAHTTFEQNWGYRGDLFDIPTLVEWWKQNRPGVTPLN